MGYWIHDVLEGMTIHEDSCQIAADKRYGPYDAARATLVAQAFAAAMKVYNCQRCGGSRKLNPLTAVEAVAMLEQLRCRTGLVEVARQKVSTLFGGWR